MNQYYIYTVVSAQNENEAFEIADQRILTALEQESTIGNTLHIGQANIDIIDTHETIVDNWFPKDILEGLIEEPLSHEEYQEFKKWLDESSLANDSSNMIAELYDKWILNKQGVDE